MLKNGIIWFPLFIFFSAGSFLGIDKFLPLAFFLLAIVVELLSASINAFFSSANWSDGLSAFWRKRIFRIEKIELDPETIIQRERRASRFAVFSFKLLSLFSLFFALNILGPLLFSGKVEIADSLGQKLFYLIVYVVVGYAAKFGKRNLDGQKDEASVIQQSWFKALLSLSAFYGFLLFLGLITFKIPEIQAIALFYVIDIGTLLVYLFSFSLLAEALIKNLKYFVNFLKKVDEPSRVRNLHLFEAFFSRDSIKASFIAFLKKLFGLDLEKSEIANFFVSIFEPVVIFSLFLIWLASSLVIVPPTAVGVFYNSEKIVSKTATSPGLYLKSPWPIGKCELFEKNKVRVVNVGFEPSENTRHLIWTKSHATRNFNLIVGDGLEIISIDCQIMYRVKNVHNYLTQLKNPEELIQALAYRFLTLETVSSTFDEIMVKDSKKLASRLEKRIQLELDKRNLGVAIIEVVFLAMHPPLEVAGSFEDVISAQIDRLTLAQDANSEAVHIKLMNVAMAKGEVFEAGGYSASLIAEATGKGQAFVSKSLGYNFSPELAKFRLKMERFQKFIQNKKLYVIDKTLLRASDKLYLKLSE